MSLSPEMTPRCELAFEIEVSIGELIVTGATKYGTRQLFPILGGQVLGPRLKGEVLHGGADWQLLRDDGVLELDARYVIRADDGSHIQVRNRGLVRAADNGLYIRTVPEFEASKDSQHTWLNLSLFVGTVVLDLPKHVRVFIYEVV